MKKKRPCHRYPDSNPKNGNDSHSQVGRSGRQKHMHTGAHTHTHARAHTHAHRRPAYLEMKPVVLQINWQDRVSDMKLLTLLHFNIPSRESNHILCLIAEN